MTEDLDAAIAQASRRGVLRGAGMGGMAAVSAAVLAACGKSSSASNAAASGAAISSGPGDFAKTPGFKFTFVNHVTTNPFFQATQYGLQDAAALLGLPKPAWVGSETSDVSQMVNAFNTAITSKVDGIAVALVDSKAFNEPTEKALAAGIPVVSYNADVTTNARLNYIGQDLYSTGQAMGERIASLFPSGGSIVIFIATPGSLNIQPRADGAIAALKASGKNFTVKQVATGADINAEQTAIDAFYTGNKDFKGLFAVDAGSTQGIANVMKEVRARGEGLPRWRLRPADTDRERHQGGRSGLHDRPVRVPAGFPCRPCTSTCTSCRAPSSPRRSPTPD